MFATCCKAGILVAFDKSVAVLGDLLRVITTTSDTDRLETSIGEDVQDGTEDEIYSHSGDFLSGCFCYVVCQIGTACCSYPHGRGKLANVVLVEETIDTAILLVQSNE